MSMVPKYLKGKEYVLLIEKLYSRATLANSSKSLEESCDCHKTITVHHLLLFLELIELLGLYFNMLFRRCHALDRGAESMCFLPLITSHSLVQHTCGTAFWSCLDPRQARRCASAGPYPPALWVFPVARGRHRLNHHHPQPPSRVG